MPYAAQKKDNPYKGWRKATKETWPWVYWALKAIGPLHENKKRKLAEAITDLGGPKFSGHLLFDRLRSYERDGLVAGFVEGPTPFNVTARADEYAPYDPYAVEKEAEKVSDVAVQRIKQADPELERLLEEEERINNEVAGATEFQQTDSDVFVRSTPWGTVVSKCSTLNTDGMTVDTRSTIEERLVAISNLADSILIEGVPHPHRDFEILSERLSERLDENAALRRQIKKLEEQVANLNRITSTLRNREQRLTKNIEALAGKRMDDTAFKELRRVQQETPKGR
jgi:hypothetical protein